jgi:hypothetical protein
VRKASSNAVALPATISCVSWRKIIGLACLDRRRSVNPAPRRDAVVVAFMLPF